MIINQEKPEEEWLRNCLKFHPDVPEQNPVEGLWLQAKKFIRQTVHFAVFFK